MRIIRFMMKLLAVVFFLFCFLRGSAQQFGGFPPRTKWKQVNSDTARIIFTPDATAQAQQIATLIHRMAKGTPNPLGNGLRKINIILQSHTTLANGYVALGPFRSEYYLIPGGNIFEFGNLPWNEQLAVHEYRHVQQYSNFNKGVSKVFYYLLGQQGQAFANALSIPDWFFEGDAVHAETSLTVQGRGRLPSFLNAYRSIWQDDKHYSWMKLRNGSLKDYVPNHYDLGYLLVNYGYARYGPLFWEKVTKDASAFKSPIYPFQQAVKKYTGLSFRQFRNDAFDYYQKEWGLDKQHTVQQEVVNYHFPQYIGNDSLLYLKSSYNHLPAFVVKDQKGEHTISLKDIGAENWFAYHNGTIVYTVYATDARWPLIDYSDIVLLDMAGKKERRLTSKGKYFTPVFSPDGSLLMAVNSNDSLQTELHFFDVNSGKLVKKITSADNSFYSNPAFVDDRTIVTGVRLPNGYMALQQINMATDSAINLLPPSPHTMGFAFAQNDTVYFTASFSGNDDLYALLLNNHQLYQLTNSQTGNYYPHVYGGHMTWSNFTSHGNQWQQRNVKELLWKKVAVNECQPSDTMYHVANASVNILQTPERHFTPQPYGQSFGLVRVHSWQPSYTTPEYTLTAYSNNILNTLNGEAYYTYNENERSHTLGFNAVYGGWFPVLRAGGEYTFNRHIRTANQQLLFNQYEVRLGYSIPLDFTQGKTYKLLSFGTDYVYNQRLPAGIWKETIPKASYTYLSHFVNWRQQLPKAVQHIYPRWGYVTRLQFQHRLQPYGYQASNATEVYLPSLFRNHSIVLSASFQQTDTGNVLFKNQFVNSRGYGDYFFSKMWRASANYHFPLLYPDWGFANIFYLLRLRGNLFFDYTRYYSNDKQLYRNIRSTGAELYFDTRWWNALPVTLGVRYSYLLDIQNTGLLHRNVFEVVLPVSLIPQ